MSTAAPRRSAEGTAWTLLVVCVATGLLLLNVSAPNVALPAIGQDLGAGFADLQWVVSGYALTLAAALLTAGSLADLFGRRRVFLAGLAGFLVCSAACAAAPTTLTLIVARALQGVGGAVVFSSALGLLAQEFRGDDRGRALGVWGATVAFAFAVGPLEGGLLIESFGWRSIFAVNVVLGLPLALLAGGRLTESRDPDARGVDWPGVATLSSGLFVAVFALVRGNALGWGSVSILGLFAVAALLLGSFLAIERRSRAPMLDLGLFRKPTFSGASFVVAAFAASTFGPILYITLFLLEVRGASPAQAGLQLMPFAAVSFVVAVVGGRYSARLPLRVALGGGMGLCLVGLLLLHGVDARSDWVTLLPGLVVAGAGAGLVNPAATFAHLSSVPDPQGGMASGVNNTFRQLGVAVGIAALGALFQRSVTSTSSGLLQGAPLGAGGSGDVARRLGAGDLQGALSAAPRAGRTAVQHAYDIAFAGALDELFLVGAAVAALATVVGLACVRRRDYAPA